MIHMPELPDVETVISRIKPYVVGKIFKDAEIFVPELIQLTSKSKFKQRLMGTEIINIWRRGKFILFPLGSGFTLIVHLRMTGDLTYCNVEDELHKHTRAIFTFKSGKQLRFTDQRKLGKIYLVPDEDYSGIKALQNMGPEPLSKDFTYNFFRKLSSKRKAKIKSLLIDQSFIAGIGNVYGDVILWQARINPEKHANELTSTEIERLFQSIKYILGESVRNYDLVHGRTDWFLTGRDEGICPRCGSLLSAVKIQGRYSHFCSRCQLP